MKKIGCITYHASHNYGSCLQAYALQEFILKNFKCSYEIINLRTKKQLDLYSLCFDKGGLKNMVKSFMYSKHKRQLYQKYEKYEIFINERLRLTPNVFNSIYELKKYNFDYDCCISGSDQIWNTSPTDFDWSYFLGFIDNCTKASYAASFGPIEQKWDDNIRRKIKKYLKKFDYISVREEKSYDAVRDLSITNLTINVDPTMLLSKCEWDKIIRKKQYQEGDYILFYDLKNNKNSYKIVKKISKEIGLPVVVVQENSRTISSGFIKRFDAGPEDFLNLIKNAKLVISTSFHGNVFSIIMGVPFFAIDGENDFRINNLLKIMGLENRSINAKNFTEKIPVAFDIDYTKAEPILLDEIGKSREYLKDVINS